MKQVGKQARQQKGMSTVGWILVVGLFGMLLVTFFKVFPMYYGNFKVKSALQKIQQDISLDSKSKRAIWESLQKRLYVDEVRNVKREHVTMVRKDGKTTVTVSYEIRDDLFGNMFIGASFSDSVVIDR